MQKGEVFPELPGGWGRGVHTNRQSQEGHLGPPPGLGIPRPAAPNQQEGSGDSPGLRGQGLPLASARPKASMSSPTQRVSPSHQGPAQAPGLGSLGSLGISPSLYA